MHKYHFVKSRQNTIFWSKVGKMGVGEAGIGKQVSIWEKEVALTRNFLEDILSHVTLAEAWYWLKHVLCIG